MFLVAVAHVILELQAGGGERIVHRHKNILAVLAIDHNLRPRQRDDQAHRDLYALALVSLQRFGEHLATANVVTNAFEPLHLFTDIVFERIGRGNAAQRNLYQIVHSSRPLLAPADF